MRQYTERKRPMAPTSPRFFGYGSLVNRSTHHYPMARQGQLDGWRRVWVHVAARPVAYLSVEPYPQGHILGLVADVPGGDWQALDEREAAYDRQPVAIQAEGAVISAQVYAVPDTDRLPPSRANPLILSYIDVVVQGFLQEFGEAGVQHFFATTHGWGAPILDDRAAPIYPRHRVLNARERALVDQGLAGVGAQIIAKTT